MHVITTAMCITQKQYTTLIDAIDNPVPGNSLGVMAKSNCISTTGRGAVMSSSVWPTPDTLRPPSMGVINNPITSK